MIAVSANQTIREAQRLLEELAHSLPGALDDGVRDGLDELLGLMRPLTPVVTGNMKAGYYVEDWGGGHLALMDRMDYAGRVVELPQHAALAALLNDAAGTLTAALDRAVTSVVGR